MSEIKLSYAQRHTLDNLTRRLPHVGWHGIGSRTMKALARMGLVELRNLGASKYGPRLDWRATRAGWNYMRRVRLPYCPFCKKAHAGGDTCLGHYP